MWLRLKGLALGLALIAALSGCGTSADAAQRAVADTRAAVIFAHDAGRLLLDGRATRPYVQVVFGDSVQQAADAERDLLDAVDLEPGRVTTAHRVVDAAASVLDELADHGVGTLDEPALGRLDAALHELDAAARELQS